MSEVPVLHADDALIKSLQIQLEQRADPKTKDWWERYLKHVISFRGVKMADIRKALQAWLAAEQIAERFEAPGQKTLAISLIKQDLAEDKLAGILYFQEVLIPQQRVMCASDLPRFADLFDAGFIYDRNIYDWFCVKMLGLWQSSRVKVALGPLPAGEMQRRFRSRRVLTNDREIQI
ncbi:MAG: DNA alkylation repair protein [Chloroflexi bacterium]|nr:DNA alkylation repair protein [Chloroflexota bacterium]